MKLHWGTPELPARIMTRLPNIRSAHLEYRTYRHNAVKSLFGISFGERLFIGVLRMGVGVHEENRCDTLRNAGGANDSP